jgi:hypothetical protein
LVDGWYRSKSRSRERGPAELEDKRERKEERERKFRGKINKEREGGKEPAILTSHRLNQAHRAPLEPPSPPLLVFSIFSISTGTRGVPTSGIGKEIVGRGGAQGALGGRGGGGRGEHAAALSILRKRSKTAPIGERREGGRREEEDEA